MTDTPVYFNDVSSIIPVSTTFTTSASAATDPAAVSIVVTDPVGTATTYAYTAGNVDPNQVVQDSTGNYHINLQLFGGGSPPPAGLWTYVWVGTGGSVANGAQVNAGSFRVFPLDSVTGSNRYYCSPAELKSRLNIKTTDTSDDYEIQLACQTVTDWITSYCGQYFYQLTETRNFAPTMGPWTLLIDNVVSITSFKLDYDGDGVFETSWTEGTQYELYRFPRNYNVHDHGVARPNNFVQVINPTSGPEGAGWLPFIWPFSRQDRIQIEAVWGWESVPPAVNGAALILAADLFKAKDAPWGVAGIGDMGMVKVQSNPWVVELLRDYISGSGKVGV